MKSFRWVVGAVLLLTMIATACSSNKSALEPKSNTPTVDSKAASTAPKSGGR
jgi:hypothetical protein